MALTKAVAHVTLTIKVNVGMSNPDDPEVVSEAEEKVLGKMPDLLWRVIKDKFIVGADSDDSDYAVNFHVEHTFSADDKVKAREEAAGYINGRVMLQVSELLELEQVRDLIAMRLCGELLDELNIVHAGNDVSNIHIQAAGRLLPEQE